MSTWIIPNVCFLLFFFVSLENKKKKQKENTLNQMLWGKLHHLMFAWVWFSHQKWLLSSKWVMDSNHCSTSFHTTIKCLTVVLFYLVCAPMYAYKITQPQTTNFDAIHFSLMAISYFNNEREHYTWNHCVKKRTQHAKRTHTQRKIA